MQEAKLSHVPLKAPSTWIQRCFSQLMKLQSNVTDFVKAGKNTNAQFLTDMTLTDFIKKLEEDITRLLKLCQEATGNSDAPPDSDILREEWKLFLESIREEINRIEALEFNEEERLLATKSRVIVFLNQCLTASHQEGVVEEQDELEAKANLLQKVDNQAASLLQTNKAHQHFIDAGGEKDQRRYEVWYSEKSIAYLLHSTARTLTGSFIPYVFINQATPDCSFSEQFRELMVLRNLIKQDICFIAAEPSSLHVPHFVYGVLTGDILLFINPVGLSKHHDFKEALVELHKHYKLTIYLSRNVLQQESGGLVSCGPICVELALGILAQSKDEWANSLRKLRKSGKGKEQESAWLHRVDISSLLPPTLQDLSQLSETAYQERLIQIRTAHGDRLTAISSTLPREVSENTFWDKCENAAIQVVMNQLCLERKNIIEVQTTKAYLRLKKPQSISSYAEHSPKNSEKGNSVKLTQGNNKAVLATNREPFVSVQSTVDEKSASQTFCASSAKTSLQKMQSNSRSENNNEKKHYPGINKARAKMNDNATGSTNQNSNCANSHVSDSPNGIPTSIDFEITESSRRNNDIINFSEDLHIRNIQFTGASKELPAIFKDSNTWDNVPSFAIITGPNGSGKSQLLKYIHNNVTNREVVHFRSSLKNNKTYLSEKEVIFIDSKDCLDHLFYDASVDTSYPLSNEQEMRKCVNEIIDYYAEKRRELTDRFAVLINEKIQKALLRESITRESIDEKYITDLAQKTIDYELNELRLTKPLSFLTYIVAQYEKRKEVIKNNVRSIKGALTLFDYYTASTKESKLDLRSFLEQINSDKKFIDKILDDYTGSAAGPSPLENINTILSSYGFKYTIGLDKNERIIFFKEGELTIVPHSSLSSGEVMILSMMAWQYYAQGLSAIHEDSMKQLDNNIKLMLLDEPDKHLDPKLCKLFYKIIYEEFYKRHNIQIIMTTHRLDTIILAPEDNIFLLRPYNDANVNITKVHKLQAIFRMSYNLRELLDYHHKVYTESIDDARFYEGVYHSLKELSDHIRLENEQELGKHKTDKKYYWSIGGSRTTPIRLLSNRYQVSFYSVSKRKNDDSSRGDGGCQKVLSSINEDLTALKNLAKGEYDSENKLANNRWLRSRRVFTDVRLYTPYGIVDNDYDKKYNFESTEIEKHIVQLTNRHSLENYIFDPIIFCSVLNENEISNAIQRCNINHKGENEILEADFISACLNIKHMIASSNYEQLQPYLESYFRIVIITMLKYYKYRPPNKQKTEEIPVYNNMKAKVGENSDLLLCDTDITFIISATSTFKVFYPKEFLIVRGHDIEDFFWGKKNPYQLVDKIASKIYQNGLQLIPQDLAEVYFILNERIRRDIRAVIKPITNSTTSAPTIPSELPILDFTVNNFIAIEPLAFLLQSMLNNVSTEILCIQLQDINDWLASEINKTHLITIAIEKIAKLDINQKLFVVINIHNQHFTLLALIRGKHNLIGIYCDSAGDYCNTSQAIDNFLTKIDIKLRFTKLLKKYQSNNDCAIHVYELVKILLNAKEQEFNNGRVWKKVRSLRLNQAKIATRARLDFAKSVLKFKEHFLETHKDIIIDPELLSYETDGRAISLSSTEKAKPIASSNHELASSEASSQGNSKRTTTMVKEQHAVYQDKMKDIHCLQKMAQKLQGRHSSSSESIDSLYEVTKLCSGEEGLLFNDCHDRNTYYIRNRYGMKVRNKGNKLNENVRMRIDFEMLYRLKVLLEGGYKLEADKIETDLKLLHDKIQLILKHEYNEDDTFFKKEEGKFAPIDDKDVRAEDLIELTRFVNENYPIVILSRLKEEAHALSQIKEINKDSVYFISRKMVVIGELFHEYGELFPELRNVKGNNMFSLYHLFVNFRNRLIHFDLHQTIIHRLREDKSKELESALFALSSNLTIFFEKITSIDITIVGDLLPAFKDAREPLKKIASLLSPNRMIKIRKEAVHLLIRVDRLLSIVNSRDYRELTSLVEGHLLKFKDQHTLYIELERGLKEHNPAYLIKLLISYKKIIEEGLAENKETLKRLIQAVKQAILDLQAESIKLEVIDFLELEGTKDALISIFGSVILPGFDINNLKYNKDTRDAFDRWLKVIKSNHKIIAANKKKGDEKCSEYKLYRFLTNIKDKLKQEKIYGGSIEDYNRDFNNIKNKFVSLKPDERKELEMEFNFSVSTDIEVKNKIAILVEKNTTQERLNSPIIIYSNKIHKEMEYFKFIECSDLKYRDVIIEHIITLIGQYIRDIETIAIYDEILLSNTAAIAAQTARSARSKGLAHEIFHFDKQIFEQKLLRHITPSASDFSAIATIYKNSGLAVSKTSLFFVEIADAFRRLGQYSQATDYYNNALQAYKQETPENEFIENSLQSSQELGKRGVTQPTAVLLDHSKLVFGISIFELQVYAKIQEAYLVIGDVKQAIDTFNACMIKLNLDEIFKYKHLIENSSLHEKASLSSMSAESREKLFEKNKEYYFKVSNILQRIIKEKRPFVILIDGFILFTSIADILHLHAKTLMIQEKLDDADKLLLSASGLITGEVKHKSDSGITFVNVPTCDFNKLANYYLDMARCKLSLNELVPAGIYCSQAMQSNNIYTRLNSYYLDYFIKRRVIAFTDNMENNDLEKIVKKCILTHNAEIPHLKKYYGDESLHSIEKYHQVRIDYFVFTRNFSELNSYLISAEKDTLTDFGLSLEKAFPNLYLSILDSISSNLTFKLSKEDYKNMLDFMLQYVEQATHYASADSQRLMKYSVLYSKKLKEYITHYFSSNITGFLEIAELSLKMVDNKYTAEVIIPYIALVYSNYSEHGDELSQLGKRYLQTATHLFDNKSYELANPYFKLSIKLLSHGGSPAELMSCWYRFGELLMACNQHSKAVIAYKKAIELSQKLPSVNFLSKDASEKSTDALKKFCQLLKAEHDESTLYFKRGNHKLSLDVSHNALKKIVKFEKPLKNILHASLNDNLKKIKGHLLYVIGMNQRQLGEIESAKENFRQCIRALSSCQIPVEDKIAKAKQHFDECTNELSRGYHGLVLKL